MANENKNTLLSHNERLEQISATLDVLPILEDLTPELNDQADIITAINDLLGLKGQAVPYGDYVWKRYKETTISLTQLTVDATPTIIQVSCDTVDLTKVDASWFVGFKGTYTLNGTTYPYEIISPTVYRFNATDFHFVYDPVTCQISVTDFGASARTWSDATGTDIDYIVSSSPDAYPEAGEQDGYYYEKVKDPVPTMEYGSVSCASEVASVTVQHSLGVVPSKVYLIRDAGFTSGYGWAQLNGTAIRCYSSSVHSAKANTVTDTSITFIPYSSSYGWYGTYTWIAIV